MSIWNHYSEKTGLEKARDDALLNLANFMPDDEKYSEIMVHVKTLTELIKLEKREGVSPNTLAIILGNTIIGLIVVGYESKNVVTTKVLPFLSRVS